MNENEFRNYFCVVVGGENFADIEQLVGIGLMSWGFFLNGRADRYAHVTDAGIREVMP